MTQTANVYIVFFKPFGVVTQFSPLGAHETLSNFGPFPSDVYPVGRLDADSEGLLLLTNDDHVKHRLTDPRFGHPRTYLVQVEGTPTAEALERLRRGVQIEGKITRPARVSRVDKDPLLSARSVPIRFRKTVPTSWIELTLFEGRNRQVRKMTASVGCPTLRLVRTAIDCITVEGLKPGEWRHLHRTEVEHLMTTLVHQGSEVPSRRTDSMPGTPGRRRNRRHRS